MKVYYNNFSNDKLYKEDFYYEIIDELDVNSNNLENIFQDGRYYLAMKKLSLLEKQVLYYLYVKEYSFEELSLYLEISKEKIIEIKNKAIINFKKNLKYEEKKDE